MFLVHYGPKKLVPIFLSIIWKLIRNSFTISLNELDPGELPTSLTTRITWFSSLLHKVLRKKSRDASRRNEGLIHAKVCERVFFNKLVGWNSSTELRITFFKDNFQGFWLNEHLPMATSRSCKNCLKSTGESFLS